MSGDLVETKSLIRLYNEKSFEQMFTVGGQKEGNPVLTFDHPIAEFKQRGTVEGQGAADQHVQDDSE